MCWALTGDFGRGEDLAQASLQRLWPRWASVSATGDPWPYLQRIAVSQAATWRRRRWLGETPWAVLPDRGDATDHADSIAGRRTVQQWLDTLPPRRRAVIVLRFLVDLSVDETADRLGCSTGTVKSQTAKALGKLRDLLGPGTLKESNVDE
jgi:RNA polymerase sigma factor, sigma-70 family